MTGVLLVDDHPLFRHALRSIITRRHPQLAIREAETLEAARKVLAKETDIALVLLDMKMSDSGGFTGLLNIKSEFPQIPVAIVSASGNTATIKSAVTFGAAGFIPKSAKRADIAKAIETLLAGEVWLPVPITPSAGSKNVEAIASLTPAQLRILLCLQRGLRNKEIAREIGVSERTIKAYTGMMFIKLGVNSRTQAVILAQSMAADLLND
jgi:DNA-binding NarL/FixJ family response regulator